MLETIVGFLYTFMTMYLIPFIFAIGLIMFLYGSVNYFVIGPGEEPKREEGRLELLWSFLLFLLGLAIYGVIMIFVWLGTGYVNLISGDADGEGGVDAGVETGLQRVPDVPRENN